MQLLTKITNFLREVRLEMKKVNWPTRQETFRYTVVVVAASAAVAFFLGGLDVFFQFVLERFVIK